MKYRSCKDCPQYEKCVTTSNLAIKRKRCEFADNSRNKKPLTNFDRVKAMSVEEMATAIYNGISSDPCDYCEFNNGHCTGVACRNKSHTEIIAKYLESEVQGDV